MVVRLQGGRQEQCTLVDSAESGCRRSLNSTTSSPELNPDPDVDQGPSPRGLPRDLRSE